ncbi:hypothetical protein [Kordiimonas aquimaris]|uniref:hypothetical protein n=1 Tax=Kordiimonas aquimaris TaxID=707591 RepID=UPI0021D29885|nr:hypothetical protein [Kordiimonas aquimaris]
MLSLLGSLLGFGTGIAPRILGYFERRRDQKHDLAMMEQQRENMKLRHGNTMEQTTTQGEIDAYKAAMRSESVPSGNSKVDALRGSVRPVVTYLYTLIFIFVEVSLFWIAMKSGMDAFEASKVIWTPEVQATYASILSFWFASRTFGSKAKGA